MKNIKAVFIRHGLSTYNDEGRIAGRVDVPLSETGIKRLKEIKREVVFPTTELYYCTPLKRTRQTAEILFGGGSKFVERPEFMEMMFGDVDGILYEEINLGQLFRDWYDGIDRDNVERIKDFENRINTAIEGLIKEVSDKGVASFTLISHSCVMRNIKHYFEPMGRDEFLKFRTINGKGFVVDVEYDEERDLIVDSHIKYL